MGADMLIAYTPVSKASVEVLMGRLGRIFDERREALASCLSDTYGVDIQDIPDLLGAEDIQNVRFGLEQALLALYRVPLRRDIALERIGGREYHMVGGLSWGDGFHEFGDAILTLNELKVTYDEDWNDLGQPESAE